MLKKFLICIICSLICVICVYAQETLTITTYYPSPYGSYNELQLYPHSTPVTPCNSSTRGTMYFDSDDGLIKVCDGAGWLPIGGISGSGTLNYLAKWTGISSLGNSQVFDNGSNVGIGTTSPSQKLDVAGSVQWSGTLVSGSVPWPRLTTFPSACPAGQFVRQVGTSLTCDTPGAVSTGSLSAGANITLTPNPWNPGSGLNATISATVGGPGGVSGSGTTNYIPIWTGSTSLGNSVLYQSGTNVGIGTTGPDAKLRVVGGGIRIDAGQTISAPGRLHIQAENENLYLNPWSGTTYVGYGGGPGNLFISGNVGIGTTSTFTDPRGQTARLNVNGPINFRPGGHTVMMTNTPGYLEYCIDGNYWGVTIWASSKRFKENITDLELDSSKIYDLNPVSFNWKPERGGQRDFGIIAEQAAEILPLLVAYDKEGKPFSVKYDLLSVLLLNELKKKAFEIKALNETVEQLKTRIEKLESLVDALQRALEP